MEVSENKAVAAEPEGVELVHAVLSSTGLPHEWIGPQLEQILDKSGHQTSCLTLEELRIALAAHLEELNQAYQQEFDQQGK